MKKLKYPGAKFDADIHIKCSEAFKEKINEIAKRKGLNESALVRMTLTELIDKESKKEP